MIAIVVVTDFLPSLLRLMESLAGSLVNENKRGQALPTLPCPPGYTHSPLVTLKVVGLVAYDVNHTFVSPLQTNGYLYRSSIVVQLRAVCG